MNATIALLLAQDGLSNGVIYALLAISILLVFLITRVLLVPQGEFVVLAALTMVQLHKGARPSAIWLLLALALTAASMSTLRAWRTGDWGRLPAVLAFTLGVVLVGAAASAIPLVTGPGAALHIALSILGTLVLVAPLGPLLYWSAFEGIARASILTLLFAAVAVHYVLQGSMLPLFGPEGFQAEALISGRVDVGFTRVSVQLLLVCAIFFATVGALWMFIGHTIAGKILRATAVNTRGARIVGIRPETSGAIAFGLASLIGAVSGVLIAPLTTLYYDSGFLLALKGFVGAVTGGFASFPLAAAGSLFIGVIEAMFSFQFSALKDSLVFAALLPILLILSSRHLSDRDAEPEE